MAAHSLKQSPLTLLVIECNWGGVTIVIISEVSFRSQTTYVVIPDPFTIVITVHFQWESILRGGACRWYYWADHLGILVWQDMPSMFWEDHVIPKPSPQGAPLTAQNAIIFFVYQSIGKIVMKRGSPTSPHCTLAACGSPNQP